MDKTLIRTITTEIRASEDSRTVTFVASDGARDSHGTVLNQEGWDLSRFNSNGVIGYQHKVYGGYEDTDNPDNVIGKGRAYLEDGRLMVDVEFEPADINELAEKVYRKVQFGSLKAVSVGFLPVGKGKWGEGEEALDGDSPTYYYAGQELLEVSIVNIPSNPNALRRGLDTGADEVRELEAEERARLAAEAEEAGKDKPGAEPVDALELQRSITVAEATLLT